jgi:hypothetical protein
MLCPKQPMNFWEANPDKIAELPELAKTMTAGQIANMWGVTRNTISGKMDRLGIKRPNKPGRPKREMRSTPFRPTPSPSRFHHPWRPPEPTMPRQAPTDVAERVFPHAADIWRLTDKSCRYPLWRDGEPISEKMYCGDSAIKGSPYCAACARVAYWGEQK